MVDILIVEDNPELSSLLGDFPRQEHYTVSVADSGEKALGIYEKYGARLVVLDVLLPGMDGYPLVTVRNSGCSLPDTELPHLFDSFWRGSNAQTEKGSGLGLYICRQLMHKMNGEIFAEIKDAEMCVTAVFEKA